jgi:palmitoyl transferase
VWGTLFIFAFAVQAETKVYGEQRVSCWWNWLKDDVSQTWNQPQNYEVVSAISQLAQPLYVR